MSCVGFGLTDDELGCIVKDKKLSYRRDSARCGRCHSMSLKVIRCCANRRGIYTTFLY